jgi:Ca2+-transporting ATPase
VQVERDGGLTDNEVQATREKSGWNELPHAEQLVPVSVFLRQFSSLLVLILVFAAAHAVALGEWSDAGTIGVVVILNAVLGFAQEWRAETALSALRSLLSPKAMVIRNGQEQTIPARDLVPGDLIVLSAGARIPADATLTRSADIATDESILTGESVPVTKSVATGDAQVFTGTAVTMGRAEARVTAIGAQTEFGKIAHLTGSVGTKQTNLQRKLGALAQQLGLAALVISASVMGLGMALGREAFEMVMTGLSLAVAVVPEGLPAVVTITLALGANAMVRQNALARRLQAVETLGATSVICTDKTGTLTENKMTATHIWTRAQSFDVTGTGYDPAGHIEAGGKRVRASDDPLLAAVLQTGLYCSHARIEKDARHGG